MSPATFQIGHNVLTASISYNSIDNPISKCFENRDVKNIVASDLTSFLCHCDWSAFDVADIDVGTALGELRNHLQAAIEKLAPIKIIKQKKAEPPWVSAELSQL